MDLSCVKGNGSVGVGRSVVNIVYVRNVGNKSTPPCAIATTSRDVLCIFLAKEVTRYCGECRRGDISMKMECIKGGCHGYMGSRMATAFAGHGTCSRENYPLEKKWRRFKGLSLSGIKPPVLC